MSGWLRGYGCHTLPVALALPLKKAGDAFAAIVYVTLRWLLPHYADNMVMLMPAACCCCIRQTLLDAAVTLIHMMFAIVSRY